MDPNDLIDSIIDAIDYAEIARDRQGLIKARRLLNNDLRQAIDMYIQEEVRKAAHHPATNLEIYRAA
jgi:HD superfamily phosphohydrolase YqeK